MFKKFISSLYKFSPKMFVFLKGLTPLPFRKILKKILTYEKLGTLKNEETRFLYTTENEPGKFRYKITSVEYTQGQLFSLLYTMELMPWVNSMEVPGVEIKRLKQICNKQQYIENPLINLKKARFKKERILIVLPSFWRGGTEISMIPVVEGLIGENFDVWVVSSSLDIDPSIYYAYHELGANLVFFPQSHSDFPYTRAIVDLVQYIKPTYYLISNSDKGYYALPYIKNKNKVKAYDILHSEAPLGGSKEFEEFIEKHIAVSDYIKSFFIEKFSPKKNTITIYNGVNIRSFSNNKKTSKVSKIIFLGRLSSEKRPLDFVKIAEKFPRLSFFMYGEGPEEQRIKEYIAKNNLKNIHLKGFTKNPRTVLAEADCLILTSVNESFGLVVLEAISAGVIVLSTRVGIAAEIIEDGINGFLANTGDLESFSKKLNRIISLNENDISNIKSRAIKTIYEAGLDSGKMVDGYLKIFKK